MNKVSFGQIFKAFVQTSINFLSGSNTVLIMFKINVLYRMWRADNALSFLLEYCSTPSATIVIMFYNRNVEHIKCCNKINCMCMASVVHCYEFNNCTWQCKLAVLNASIYSHALFKIICKTSQCLIPSYCTSAINNLWTCIPVYSLTNDL